MTATEKTASDTTAPSSAETRAFMQRYAEVLGGPKTPERLRPLIADDALLRHIAEAEAAFPGYTIEVRRLIVEDAFAVLQGTLRGVHEGVFQGLPPTGRAIEVALFVLYEIRDDRIVRHEMVLDSPALMQQLGALSGGA